MPVDVGVVIDWNHNDTDIDLWVEDHNGEGAMLKGGEEGLILDFEKLPKEKQTKIEQIIERKIKERQEQGLKRLLKEVTEEIERTQQQLEEDD